MANDADPSPSGNVDEHCPHVIARPVMRQRWVDATFAHWPIDPELVRAVLPDGLEPDLFDGQAWVSLVGFEMDQLRIPGLPAIPTTSHFPEFNVRTYVTGPAGPGVWFCSLDVPHWLPVLVARVGFSLPYDRGSVDVSRTSTTIGWSVRRTWPNKSDGALSVRLTDERVDFDNDPLAVFLTARWRLYATSLGGRLLTAPLSHEPWPLTKAELINVRTGLADSAGLPVSGEPIVHHASLVSVLVGMPRLVAKPGPAQPPIVLHFDDDCGVCSTSVRALERFTDSTVTYEPNRNLNDPALERLAEDVVIVTGEGGPWFAVAAVSTALGRTGRLGRVIGAVLGLPVVRTLAGFAYRLVARNRQRISARLGLVAACELPARK
jgi:uncharacterized protein YqjF (DUF2071 family)/predicted DCC family thiol-disulfide oxidoreductase YuxK